MKPSKFVTIALLLSALSFLVSHSLANAGDEKKKSKAGGQAESHMSSRGSANTNAQWTADPERGWVRADERHERHKQNQSENSRQQDRGKHKGRDKK